MVALQLQAQPGINGHGLWPRSGKGGAFIRDARLPYDTKIIHDGWRAVIKRSCDVQAQEPLPEISEGEWASKKEALATFMSLKNQCAAGREWMQQGETEALLWVTDG